MLTIKLCLVQEGNKESAVKQKTCFFLCVDGKDSNTKDFLKKSGNPYTINKDKVYALKAPPSLMAVKLTDKMHKLRLNKKEKEPN